LAFAEAVFYFQQIHIYFTAYMLLLTTGGNEMGEMLILTGILVGWVVLQKYILPRFGVST
jgi:hypothetical protein